MRILVYEFASGGGLAGRIVPPSIAREGAAMRAALVDDLSALGHQIVTTADASARFDPRPDVRVVPLPDDDRARAATLGRLIADTDSVWLIAPETGRCLERLAARVAQQRTRLLGSPAEAIRCASDKARLPRLLAAHGIGHPATWAVDEMADALRAADGIGYPLVVKPALGAGSDGVGLVRRPRHLRSAIERARRAGIGTRVLLQRHVRGVAASVSLLCDGRDAVALALNRQTLGPLPSFSYRGGETPFEHALSPRAMAAAVAACRAVGGLRGFVGVDLVLTPCDVIVIEINPRLTTAYLGVRAAVQENVAALALAACGGRLPPAPRLRDRVRFSAEGRIRSRLAVRHEHRGAA